jgi:3-deoxy-D-manno-octulosonic-acid transferase
VNRYDLAYLTITPAAACYIAYKSFREHKYRKSIGAMLGHGIDAEDASRWANGSIWVHAVSVGETIAAKAMLPLLRKEFPDLPILLTTHTETAQN